MRRPFRNPEKLTGNICVYAAAGREKPPYKQAAFRTGELIGEHGYNLVYGGIDVGLMRQVASGARSTGARVTGVIPGAGDDLVGSDMFLGEEPLRRDIITTPNLITRKHTMLQMSDAVIALAGGIGTFDEIATTLELSRGRVRHGAVSRFVILNTDGFYDGLRTQLERMEDEGLLRAHVEDCVTFAETPEQAVGYIHSQLADIPRITPPESKE